jgi:hypothetical protein
MQVVMWFCVGNDQVVPISYFIIRFSPEAARFFAFWFTNYLSALTGVAFGMLLTFMLPGHQVVMILFGLSQVSETWLWPAFACVSMTCGGCQCSRSGGCSTACSSNVRCVCSA